MNKNPAGKGRHVNAPYASWTDLRTGWSYKLLKSYQADNSKPRARWFMDVHGFGHDMGDVYVKELIPSLYAATGLEFDTTIWPDLGSFMSWARGLANSQD